MSNVIVTQLNARILVVGADASARRNATEYLAGRGAAVSAAENAYGALGRLAEVEVDLVITDDNLPGRSGFWLIGEIRTRWPALPVILVTDNAPIAMFQVGDTPGVKLLSVPTSQDLGHAVEEVLHLDARPSNNSNETHTRAPESGPYASPSLRDLVPGRDADPEQQIPWMRRVHPDDTDRVLARVQESLETGHAFVGEYRLFSHRGDIFWVLNEARVAHGPDGERVLSHEAVVDITRQRRESEELRASEERHRFLTEYSSDMISVASWEGRHLYVSPASAALLGYEPVELIGTTFYEHVHEEDRGKVRRTHLLVLEKIGAAMIAYRIQRKDGRYVWFESTIREVPRSGSDTPRELVIVSRDITDRKLYEERLQDLAILDDLTGLYNRRGFKTLAGQHLKQHKRAKRQALLLFADLDGLKVINDTHGHADGDRAIIVAAEALNQTFRDSDVVARIGGDEFAILAVEADSDHIEAIKARLRDALDAANRINSRPYDISVSLGVVPYDPDQDTSVDELMATADKAMYSNKRKLIIN